MRKLKIATWNVRLMLPIDTFIGKSWLFSRLWKVVKRIKKENPDIICLQEILGPIQLFSLWLLLHKQYEFNSHFCTLKIFNGKTTLVNKSTTLTLMGSNQYILKNTNNKEPKFIVKRSAIETVNLSKEYKLFQIVNTHLDHRGDDDAKYRQAEELIERYKNEEVPIFICGDFNAGYKLFPNYCPMIKDVKTSKIDWWGKKENPNNLIDWIICNKNLEFNNSYTIEDRSASDHFYLTTTVTLK